jgi:ABC-type antimicrobial peptide transport system permease subunit
MMRFEQFSIVLGALLLGVVLGGLAVSLGLTNVLITPPEEGPDWIAKLIAGAIALAALAAVSYLAIREWKEVKDRRARANEERRP